MASRHLLSTGDLLIVWPKFGQAMVTVPKATLEGTGDPFDILGDRLCVEGDEVPDVLKKPLAYVSGSFSIPGTGTLAFTFNDTHYTKISDCGGKRCLRVRNDVKIEFNVAAPAIQPSFPPVPDPTPKY